MNPLRFTNPGYKKALILTVKLLLPIIICVNTIKTATKQIQYVPIHDDAVHYFAMASNLYSYGVLSKDLSGKSRKPTAYREPGYPAFLASGMSFLYKRNELVIPQVLNSHEYAIQCKIDKLKYLNIFIFIFIALTSFAAVYFLTQNYVFSLLILFIISKSQALQANVNVFLTENFTALLILLTSLSLTFTIAKKGATRYFFIFGIMLSLLTLSKAIFLYFPLFVLPFLIYHLIRLKLPGRKVLKNITVCVIGFLLFTLPWLLRNYYHFNRFFLTQRGGAVLAGRAEYNNMTHREYLASFLYWTPNNMAKKMLHALFTKADYENLDRDNLSGYRHRAIRRQLFLRKLFDDFVLADKVLLQEARDKILQHPLKHFAVTIPFAYRGIFVAQRFYIFNDYYLIKGTYLCIILFLCLFTVTIASLAEKNFILFSFFLPTLFSFLFVSFFTHNIPRYNEPLIPVLWVATILCIDKYAFKFLIATGSRIQNLFIKKECEITTTEL